jgi:hypothetical protein
VRRRAGAVKSLAEIVGVPTAPRAGAGRLFVKSVSNHTVGAEGNNELDYTSKGKFTHVVSANVVVSGVLSADTSLSPSLAAMYSASEVERATKSSP